VSFVVHSKNKNLIVQRPVATIKVKKIEMPGLGRKTCKNVIFLGETL
jgi:hypothetical protein